MGAAKSIREYTIPVHRSIIRRDLFLGIPFIPLVFLGFLTIIMVLDFQQPFFLVITVIAWYILKKITDKDEWLLDILFMALLQPDDLG